MRISDWSSDVCSSDLFQSYALFPHLTVGENIAFGLEMLGRPKEERTARVERMLALVKLQGYANHRPAQLYGGQQQRVALARALAGQHKGPLLDAPPSWLDRKSILWGRSGSVSLLI